MIEGNERERPRGAGAPRYQSWLLRCWAGQQQSDAARTNWHYSLEDPRTGARRGFASLADLVAYLQSEREEDGVAPCPTG